MRGSAWPIPGRSGPSSRARVLFFVLFLPLGVVANLALGVIILAGLGPQDWTGWLQIATGAFCCVVAGWLGAVAMSTSYWNRNMHRQIALWRRIADTFFAWVDEAPVPPDAVQRLRTSLEQVVPASEQS